jgi:integrase/recombinase XerC
MSSNDLWSASLQDLAERLSVQGLRGKRLAPSTQAAYLSDCSRIAAWCGEHGVVAPASVTASMAEAAFRDLQWAPATRRRAITALREWLGQLHPPGRSPADLVERPRVVQPPVPRLSQTDAAQLVDQAGEAPDDEAARTLRRALALRNHAILELLYGSGLRRSEVCDLSLAALDFESETVRIVGKGGRTRTVPITEPTVDALRAWLLEGRPMIAGAPTTPRNRAWVFLSRTGRQLDGSAVYRIVRRAMGAVGRRGGPHLLRHAAATHLLEGPGGTGGAHLRVVQEVLGHASLATTQRYTGVTTRALQQALRGGHPRGRASRAAEVQDG